MSQWTLRGLLVGGLLALAIGGVLLWRRGGGTSDDDAGAPIAPPSRVRTVDGEVVVAIDSEEAAGLRLQLAGLSAMHAAPEIRLPGELVPDPQRRTTIRAPLAGRLSVPAGGRWPAYGERVSKDEVLGQVSDAIPLLAPRAGAVTAVPAQPGEMVAAGQTLLELTDYSQPVARVAWHAAAPSPPARIALEVSGSGVRTVRIPATLIGAAPEADPVTRLPAYLYRAAKEWRGARPGMAITALLPAGPAAAGLLIPDGALVQWEGLVWAYVQRAPGRYIRRRVPTDRPAAGGFFVAAGWNPGDTVVVTGAEQLLSEEFRARVTVGDEQGE
jgi:multidrug efflux pump subunit AcrA (membrane-fusion protein)